MIPHIRPFRVSAMAKRLLLITVATLAIITKSDAQEFQFRPDRFYQRLYSSTIASSAQPPTIYSDSVPRTAHIWWTNDMPTNSTWYTKYKFKSISNVIRVGINHDLATVTANYSYLVSLKVRCFANPASPTTATEKLITIQVNYNKDSLQQYKDLTAYKIDGQFHAMDVIVTGILDAATLQPISRSQLAKNFYIEAEINAQRYVMQPQKLWVTREFFTAPQTNQLKVSWRHYDPTAQTFVCSYVPASDDYKPVKYELEWIYIDGYTINNYTSGSTVYKFNEASFIIPYSFKNNATSIQTYENNFTIPMVYEYGALIYRIRTVRPDSTNYGKLVYSDWNLPDTGTLTNFTFNQSQPPYQCLNNCIYIIAQPLSSDSLNWQHSVNFAEEGKYKNVLQYFDGAGYNRQTITRVNSDPGYIIAADKIYDYEGRPAIQTLPIPLQAQGLRYIPNLTLNKTTGLAYKASDFDSAYACPGDSIAPLHENALGSRYYSPLNPDQGGLQKFVPDAKGYPFMQSVYSPDNTNKVIMQGGAGPDFQVWKHPTKTSYVRADQYELNRLMGTQAGKAQFYPKQVVTDPNGQFSFSIFNQNGKVVASALIGKAPDSTKMPIVPLDNLAPMQTITTDLLANASQTIGNGLRLAEQSIFAEAGGINQLRYGVSVPPYNPSCGGKYINVKGFYKSNIVNDCGVVAGSQTGTVGTSGVTTSATAQTFSASPVSATLSTEKYTISKELYFPDTTMRRLASEFTDSSTGIGKCYVYEDSTIRRTIDAQTFPCAPGDTIGPCEQRRQQMKQELYPGAKYGGYLKNADGTFAAGAPNSIFTAITFNSNSGLPPLPGPVQGGLYAEDAYKKMTSDAAQGYSQWYWSLSPNPSTWTLCTPNIMASCFNGTDPFPPDGNGSYAGIGGPAVLPFPTATLYYKTNVYVTDLNVNNNTQVLMLKKAFKIISLFGVYVNGTLLPNSSQNVPCVRYQTLSNLQLGWNEIKIAVGTNLGDPLCEEQAWAFKFVRGCSNCNNGSTVDSAYRYQSACLGNLPNIIWQNPSSPSFIIGPAGQAPPQALIANFNDAIAEALLPLHPEYCKLAFCNDSFDKKLAYIDNYQEAVALNMHNLGGIMAQDPLNQAINSNAPFTAYQLSHFDIDAALTGSNANLIRQLDTMSLEQAYCGCNSPEAYMFCKNQQYRQQINSLTPLNDAVKDLYFQKLRDNYLSNRNLRKQRAMDGSAGCGPCDTLRMTLVPPPVFPVLFTGNGNNIVNVPGAPAWMEGVIENGLNGNAFSSVPGPIQDSINSAKLNQCKNQVRAVMTALVNCGMNATDSSNISNALVNANCGAGSNGSGITPDIVKTVLSTYGIPLSDLCSPFLAEYRLFDEQKRKDRSKFVSRRQAFYAGLSAFLNNADVKSALTTANATGGLAYAISLNTGSNEFELALSQALNNASFASIQGYTYTITDGAFSATYPCLVMQSVGYTDTLYFARRQLNNQPSTCVNTGSPVIFQGSSPGTLSFTNVRSIMDDPATLSVNGGLIADNLVYASLNGPTASANACDNYAIWSRNVPMLKERDPEALDYCINCVQIKNAVSDYYADIVTYGLPQYTNHPLYADALSNYLNYKLKKNHTYEEYERLMKGCAVSDKVLVKKMRGGYFVVFSGAGMTAPNTFLTALNTTFPDINITAFVFVRTSPQVVINVDFNSVPRRRQAAVKNFIDAYSGPLSKTYQPAPQFTAELFIKTGTCTPSVVVPNATVVNEVVQVPDATGTLWPYVWYRITSTSTDPLITAQVVQATKDYVNNPSITCSIIPFYNIELLRSSDYNDPVKQSYLNYAYSLAGQSQDDISDKLAPGYLQTNAGISEITNATLVTYKDPWCDNVKEDLYYYTNPGTAYIGWSWLTFVLNRVKLQLSQNILFPTAQVTVVYSGLPGGASLKVFKMGEGGIWYRLFTQQNRLYNVYLYPSAKMVGAPETYQMATGPDALTIIPGADSIYRFKVKMQKVINGNTHIVDCYGYTDFSIGTGKKLKNVVLYDHQNQKGCIDTMNCERQLLVNTIAQGKLIHAAYIDSIKNSHFLAMRAHFPANSVDTLMFTTQKQQYQYTLYYYDRAGNLTRTVPPAGVDTLSPATIAQVDASRNAGLLNNVPGHKKVSKYAYNAMDQLIWQQTPDAGITEFFYDGAGRLAFSQNARQKPQRQYSYILYDDQGRISETGAIAFALTEYPAGSSHPNLVSNSSTLQMPDIIAQVQSKPRQDVVATFYDNPLLNLANEGLSAQENTRKRVSTIIHASFIAQGDTVANYYDYASHFSYDALGNVSTLVQDNPYLQYMGQRFKRIDYDYDLLSGKVNMVSYNRGKADQFYQKYDYDADNRITKVQSSNDGLVWDRDASYTYYKHGPLAQMQIGDLNVQSVQYAYTIQGWLKAINGDILRPEDDMGKNSLASDSLYPRDIYAHALDYHKGDYKPIGNTPATYTDITNPLSKSLYNGNIARQTTGIAGMDNLQRSYQYDQLNRLKNADYSKVSNDVNHAVTAMANGFKNAYNYDQDGNIKTLLRKNETGTDIDNLTYQYPDPLKNRLGYVTDAVSGSPSNDLPSGQVAQNYQYDAIGNLVRDNQGQIDSVYWDLYGKVSTMEMGNENLRIHYDYDGMGNRVRKDVFKVENTDTIRTSDIYVRDASGNILAVYKDKAKVTDQLTIEWVNNDIINDHGGWTTPSGTGITPFINTFYGNNGQFSVLLMDYGFKIAPTWSNNMSLSLALNKFLEASDGIYSQAVNMPAGAYFDPLVDANVGLVAKTFEGGSNKGFEPLLVALLNPSDKDGRRIGTLKLLTTTATEVADAIAFSYGVDPGGIPPNSLPFILSDKINEHGIADFVYRYEDLSRPYSVNDFYREVVRDKALVDNNWISGNPTLENSLQGVFGNYAPREQAAEFFGQWLVTQDPAWLVHHSSGEERLHIVYQQGPTEFLNGYLDNIGIQGVNKALHGISQLTIGSYLNNVLTAVLTGTLNPTYTPPDVNTPDPANIKADTMYLAEHHLYGSSRLGIKTYNSQLYRNVYAPINGSTAGLTDSSLSKKEPWYSPGYAHWIKADKTSPYTGSVFNISLDTIREMRTLGSKRYEMTDHLGNVLAVVMDRKSGYGGINGLYNGFYANLASVSDYYPFGFGMKERSKQFTSYRSGFNGKENDNEVYGDGNFQDYGMRMYDPRIARLTWSVDPLTSKYPELTPYQFASNSPIVAVDLDGLEGTHVNSPYFRAAFREKFQRKAITAAQTQNKAASASASVGPGFGFDFKLKNIGVSVGAGGGVKTEVNISGETNTNIGAGGNVEVSYGVGSVKLLEVSAGNVNIQSNGSKRTVTKQGPGMSALTEASISKTSYNSTTASASTEDGVSLGFKLGIVGFGIAVNPIEMVKSVGDGLKASQEYFNGLIDEWINGDKMPDLTERDKAELGTKRR